MNTARFIQMSMAVVISAMLIITVVAPMVDSASKDTVTITNEGAGDLRLTYYEEPADYTISASATASELTIGTQTIDAADMIIYAFDSGAVLYADGSYKLVADDGDVAAAVDLGANCVIEGTDEGTVSFNADYPFSYTWAYVPDSNGAFGFFTDSGATVKDFPVAAAGSFAGAYAYNEINSLGMSTLAPTYSVADDVFTAGPWKLSNSDAKNVKQLTIEVKEDKVKEIEVKEITKSTVKSATPSYTDGDWGFDLAGTADAPTACLVSYTGAAGDIEIPATVTYNSAEIPVVRVGGNPGSEPIFDNASISGSTITFPDTQVAIAQYAFKNCTGFTGTLDLSNVTNIGMEAFYGCSGFTGLVLPETLTYIGVKAFYGCSGFTGQLVIPEAVTYVSNYAFYNCTGLSAIVVAGSPSIGQSAFEHCTGVESLILVGSPSLSSKALNLTNVTEALNFGNTSIPTGSSGIPTTADVRDEIPSLGYIAPASFSETVQKTGTLYTVMALLPVLIVLGILVGTASIFVSNRRA